MKALPGTVAVVRADSGGAPRRANRGAAGIKKAVAAAASLRARAAKVRAREKLMQARGAGVLAGYAGARWWAGRQATEDKGGDVAAYKVMGVTLDGRKIGLGAAAVGAMGLLGDEFYDEIAYAGGLSVFAAAEGIDAYKSKLAEPPE